MREEHFADEFSPTPYAGLVEDALQMLLHGLLRQVQCTRDLRRRVAVEHELHDVPLAAGEVVRRHEQR